MPSMKEIVCACGCGKKKMVRKADVKRGWGKYYSNKCKARHQESRTGQYRRYREEFEDDDWLGHPMQAGYFGHGQN